jgi:hypothetical protein
MKTITRKARPSRRNPQGGMFACRSSLVRRIGSLLLIVLGASCGGGGGTSTPQEIISGKVITASGGEALVCIDLNLNGRCDETDPQARADADGSYQLSVPASAPTAPLVAEVIATPTRADETGSTGAMFYRMATPSRAYSSNITPFTTLVALSGQSNFSLAEDLVRNALGLPPRFKINIDSTPSAGSFAQAAAGAVAVALQTLGPNIDLSAKGTMAQVIANLPKTFTSLPVLRISTKDAAPIVSKEVYLGATFTLTNPAVGPDAAALNGKIRGRGNSTWGQIKNPYKIQFTDDASYAGIPDFLGMKKNRNWALLADYFDRSLLRNKLAFSLGSSSVFSDGLKWTPSGQHVEVYLNDDYVGVYLLTEDIRIDPARLNIRKMSASTPVNDVDGGYLAEVDFRLNCYNQGEINLQLVTPQSVPICINTPDESAITQNQLSFIKNLLVSTERELYANDTHAINLVSFVDWYLLNELFRNPDAAFGSSVYLWKDTDGAANPQDRLLNLGPIWDFDRSAGNVNYDEQWKTEGCHVNHSGWYRESANWLMPLSANSQFVDFVIARWKQQRPTLKTFINASIDTYAVRIDEAQQRNFARWPWLAPNLVNYYPFSSHAEEVAFLKSFLNDRMVWLDKAYASPQSFNELCKQP